MYVQHIYPSARLTVCGSLRLVSFFADKKCPLLDTIKIVRKSLKGFLLMNWICSHVRSCCVRSDGCLAGWWVSAGQTEREDEKTRRIGWLHWSWSDDVDDEMMMMIVMWHEAKEFLLCANKNWYSVIFFFFIRLIRIILLHLIRIRALYDTTYLNNCL